MTAVATPTLPPEPVAPAAAAPAAAADPAPAPQPPAGPWAWSGEGGGTLALCPELARRLGTAELANRRGADQSLFEFLDQHRAADADRPLVLVESLLVFKTEGNIRAALARLLTEGAPGTPAYVAERIGRHNYPALQRAIRCLGLEHLAAIDIRDGWCVIELRRGGVVDLQAWRQAAHWSGAVVDADDVARRIQAALRERRGFSLIRFGHCETHFAGFGTHFGWSDLMLSSSVQWGASIDVARAMRLQCEISEAVYAADVLGVKPRTQLGAGKLDILNAAAMAVAMERGILRRETLRVDSNVHFELAASLAFFDAVPMAQRVVVVSPRTRLIDRLAARFQVYDRIDHVRVPGEFRVNGEGGSDLEARFEAFDVAATQIRALARPGTLLLVGAGLVGKHWCTLAKRQGAVAVDMGSVLDAWAGVQSRSSAFPARVTQLFESTAELEAA